jgi:hypothetical protein
MRDITNEATIFVISLNLPAKTGGTLQSRHDRLSYLPNGTHCRAADEEVNVNQIGITQISNILGQ